MAVNMISPSWKENDRFKPEAETSLRSTNINAHWLVGVPGRVDHTSE
jgi:hypothetical protein